MRIILLGLSISLALLCIRFVTFYQHIPVYHHGQEIALQVLLQETPQISNRGQKFVVKTRENRRITIQTDLSKLYHYGDSLAISGKLQVKKLENGYEFLSLLYPEIVASKEAENPFFEASGWVREQSSGLFASVLPSISSSLLLGIMFGSDEYFPSKFMESLKTTGVLHVIAASGMNVAFFVGAVLFSLGRFFTRRISLLLSIFVVILYTFLVGAQPSIIRASLMAMIAITASFFGRQNLALFSLFVTGFVMLLWSPAFLFDVGFQLSFMATLGILVINPRLKKLGNIVGVGEDLKTTLSAQIATFPILLGTFGSVGILGILVNVLILWTVPILMLLGTLAILFGLIVPPFGKVLLLLCLPFLWFFEFVVSLFGSLGWKLEVETFPWEIGVGYYLVLAALLLTMKQRPLKEKR